MLTDDVHSMLMAIVSMMNTVEAVKRTQMHRRTVVAVVTISSTMDSSIGSVGSQSYSGLNSMMENSHRMWMESRMVHSTPWLEHDHRTYVQRYELSMPI